LRETFLPVAVRIDYQSFPLFTDREDFLKVYEEMACHEGVYDIHHATNAEIELTGADTAAGKWSLNFRTILLASRSVTRLAVEYEDTYRKKDGRWWIETSRSRVTSVMTEIIGEDGTPKFVAWGEVPESAPEDAA
ncbi:MAG: nuclear transport factor 2 family protein, partial [Novosphingobium sp.]|nr:nuclear transport factor 2 family protein [Novosphingobium sp.]